MHVFAPKPFCVFRGHTGDIVDLDWSRANDYYLLSAGMDKTIKLWHLFFGTCLGHFTHPEPVTCVGFLPKVILILLK
jgi:WD40 repeat protein